MSNSKKPPKGPPPDDYSETTPNIDIPDDESQDWDKTSYNIASDAPPDDWGKTVINYDSSLEADESDDDLDDTYRGSRSPEQPDWGMTQTNVNAGGSFEVDDDDFGDREVETAATKHVIHIPEVDRKKFNIPPTPTEKVLKERQEKRKQGGIPVWFWLTAGMMTFFFFTLIVVLGIWWFLQSNQYSVLITGAPIGSSFHIDGGGPWGVASTKDTHVLNGLQPGTRTIDIQHPGWTCEQIKVRLEGSERTKKEFASCKKVATNGNQLSDKACDETRVVEDRERCAEQILDTLKDPIGNGPELDRLIKALNWLIINFDSGKWDIPEARKRILRKAALHMKTLPDSVLIEIGGHTDSRDSEQRNQVLSERRAKSVRDFLVNEGTVRPTILTTKGYGESDPVASNDTAAGRERNRRIEYKVIKR